jgi:hypothetical protein
MKTADALKLRPGDRVYFWHDEGCTGAMQAPMTVVKVCPKTVRLRNAYGDEFYLAHYKIDGIVDWED